MPQHKQSKNFQEDPEAAVFLFGFNKNIGGSLRKPRHPKEKDFAWDQYRERCYQDLKREGVYVRRFDIGKRSEFAYVHLGSRDEAEKLKNIGNYVDPISGERMSRLRLGNTNVVVYPYIRDRNAQLENMALYRQQSGMPQSSSQSQSRGDASAPAKITQNPLSPPAPTKKSPSYANIVSPRDSGNATNQASSKNFSPPEPINHQDSWATMANKTERAEQYAEMNRNAHINEAQNEAPLGPGSRSESPSPSVHQQKTITEGNLTTQNTLVETGTEGAGVSGLDLGALNLNNVAEVGSFQTQNQDSLESNSREAEENQINYMPPLNAPSAPNTPAAANAYQGIPYGYNNNHNQPSSPGMHSTSRSRVASEAPSVHSMMTGDSMFQGDPNGYRTPALDDSDLDEDMDFMKAINNNMCQAYHDLPEPEKMKVEQMMRGLWDASKQSFYAGAISWNDQAMQMIEQMRIVNENAMRMQQQQAQMLALQQAQEQQNALKRQQDYNNYIAALALVQSNYDNRQAASHFNFTPSQTPPNPQMQFQQAQPQAAQLTQEQMIANLQAANNIVNIPTTL